MALPSLVSLSIDGKLDGKRGREEKALSPPPAVPPAPPTTPSPLPPVHPEEVIETFLEGYNKAYEKVRGLSNADKAAFIAEHMVQLEEELHEATKAKAEAEETAQVIFQEGLEYNSDAAKAARKNTPSLKMDPEDKAAKLKELGDARQKVKTSNTKIQELNKALKERPIHIEMLFNYIALMSSPYNPSTWQKMNQAFEYAVPLWSDAKEGEFSFDVNVAPWDNRQFKMRGVKWLQDLVFQRKLLSLLPSASVSARYYGTEIIFGDGVKDLEIALSIAIATRHVKQTHNGRAIASTPHPSKRQKLIGWDIDLGLDDFPITIEPVLNNAFRNLQALNRFVNNLIERVIFNEGYTRKLAILIEEGDTGARSQVAKHACIEFGLGYQTCDKITGTLGIISAASPMFTSLYPTYIDARTTRKPNANMTRPDTIREFHSSARKVGLIGWGSHSRVIFKTDNGGCAIVDPWKPAEKVHLPKKLEEVFGSKPDWIERKPEQCGESSCSIIALVRALILVMVVHKSGDADELYRAARADILDGKFHGPIAIMLVRCAHMSATQGEYTHMEVFA